MEAGADVAVVDVVVEAGAAPGDAGAGAAISNGATGADLAAVTSDAKSEGLCSMDKDDETDVELDREVLEFQRRLEASNQQQPRRKIALPANVTFGFRK